MTFTLILLTSVFILIIILLKPYMVIYLRQLLIPAICILFVLCLILMSGTVLTAATNGLNLWVNVIVPSLFPFFVASEIISASGFIQTAGLLLEPLMRPFFNVPGSASFALAVGITSGYPMGAKITSDLRNNGSLTKVEAERLLAFTNNSGPLFIIGAVGTTMYGSTSIGIYLFACHFAACITVGLLFRFYKRSGRTVPPGRTVPQHRELREQAAESRPTLAVMLSDAVKNSITSILAVGGFVVLFSVIIQLLTDIGIIRFFASLAANLLLPLGLSNEIMKGLLSGLFSGFFEITTGSGLICSVPSATLALKLPASSFIIGWAGLSVHSQVMSIISKTDIQIRPYLFGKFLQGVIASLYTWAGLRVFHLEGTVLANATPQTSTQVVGAIQSVGAIQFDIDAFLNMAGKSLWILLTVVLLFFILFIQRSFRKK